MTTIYHTAKRDSLKREVRQIQESAKKAAATKESAKNFLISTGVYAPSGKLAAKYR